MAPTGPSGGAGVAAGATVPIISRSPTHGQGGPLAVLQSKPPKQAEAAAASPSQDELERILRLQVPVIVKLAERKLNLSEVMRLGTGAIIEFFKSSDEPLELLINNKVIGVGEAVKVGENFGLRITQIGDVKQVIRSMGDSK